MKRRLLTAVLMAVLGSVCCLGAKKSTIEISLAFSDGTKHLPWPFTEAKPSNTIKTPTAPGEEVQYTTKTGGYAFKVKSAKGLFVNSKTGFGLISSDGDYIEFPSIPGMQLEKVSVLSGKTSNMGSPVIVLSNGKAVEGGELSSAEIQGGESVVWNLKNVEKGAAVRMQMSSGAMVCLREIHLTYSGVMPKVKKAKAPKSKYKMVTVEFKDPDTGAAVWPFSTKKHTYGGNITDADMVTDNLDEFSVKCSDKAYLLSSGGYTFGKAKYSYLMLPSFGTKALVKVEMYAIKSGKQSRPAIMRQNSWKVVSGGEAPESFTAGQPQVWTLSETEPGERYRLVLTEDGGCTIEKLVLYFE